MKRINGLFNQVCSIENLVLADKKARKGKLGQYGVILHDKSKEQNIMSLHRMLIDKTYQTSEYSIFQIKDPKERDVYRLPYFPDRITHHAIMNVLKPIFMSVFTKDTYSCIEGRGIHCALVNLRKALKDVPNTQYCLKIDIQKFYPNVDHEVLKSLLRKKLKDKDLLWLLDNIIDSAPGLPIGNYLSQYLANFYLSYFDHWIKEDMQQANYFRYADDIVILGSNKADLHELLAKMRIYLWDNLRLKIKDNYQIFPVKSRGIDFVGYVSFHGFTLLRKTIKKNFAKMLVRNRNSASIASYVGWTSHCNSKNLLRKLINETV